MKNHAGNSLPEYVLIGAAVLAVSIGIIMVLGTNMQKALAGVQTNLESHAMAAKMSQGIGSTHHTLSYLDANGQMVTVNIGANGNVNGQSAQTSGANGQQLGVSINGSQPDWSQTNLSDQQADMIIELANRAHMIGVYANGLEIISEQSKGDPLLFQKLTVNIDGQTYNAKQLLNELSWATSMQSFSNLRSQIDQSGLDPGARKYVYSLGKEVVTVTNTLKDTGWQVISDQINPDQVALIDASDTSHQDGSLICAVGDGQDSGRNCH